MENNNNKISSFQFAVILFYLISALFLGMGIPNIFALVKQDSWILSIFSSILNFIPILILLYIINFKPDKNIFEKNIYLFGKIIGTIINTILAILLLVVLTNVITNIAVCGSTMYLTKTPYILIATIFVIVSLYAVFKGIETIARVGEILFFLAIIILLTIYLGLYPVYRFEELKPFLPNGFIPIIKNSYIYMSYSFTPLILLTIIPKSNIVNFKKRHVFILAIFAFINLFLVFFLVPGIFSVDLAQIFRFPAYYVLRKISVGGILDNLENILSIHWFFDNFIMLMMLLYFFNKYIKFTFKIKKDKISNIILVILATIILIIPKFFYDNPFVLLNFMKKKFALFVFLPIIIIMIITSIVIFIKRRKKVY